MQQLVLDSATMARPKRFAKYLDLAKWSRRQAHWWLNQSKNFYAVWGSKYCMDRFHDHMKSARLGLQIARGMR